MRFPFGKHRGKEPHEVPSGYLRWINSQDDFMDKYPNFSNEIEEELEFREATGTHFEENGW